MRHSLLICIFVLLSFSLLLPAYGKGKIPAPENGVLDLRAWNFPNDGPVPLAGRWKFYWQTHLAPENTGAGIPPSSLIRVPGAWNSLKIREKKIPGQGFATYVLRIRLPAASQNLGFKFLDMATAFRVYVNGKKLFSSGRPGKTGQDTIPGYKPAVIPIPEDELLAQTEILVHVSNFHHWQGGMWEMITIGDINDLNRIREAKLFRNAVLSGSIFVMGIYHLFLYRFRPRDRSPLYFGLFCLMVAIRPLTHGERYLLDLLPDMIPFTSFLRLNYIAFYFCVPLFAHYTLTLFPGQVSKKIVNGITAAGCLAAAATLMLPSRIFTVFMPYLQAGTLIAVGYGAICLIQALKAKKKDAGIFITGFLLFALTILNDVLYTRQIVNTGHIVPLGLFIFILCQAVLLSKRFSRAFAMATQHRRELEKEMIHRRRIESNLAESEFRFRQMADFLPVPLCETDRGLNIVYANRAALEWLGYSEDEMSTGMPLSTLFLTPHPEYFDLSASKLPEHREISLIRKDGNLVWAMVETSKILVKGKIHGLRICFVDLAERKKAEAASLYAAEQTKYALVGQVAGKMAHDFNNILGAIMGNTELSLLECKDRETEENLNIILEQTKRGHLLTQNLVAFARDQDPQPGCFNLNRRIELVISMLQNDLDNIKVVTTFDESLPDMLADEGMIEQSLVNTIQNAVHAMSLTLDPGLKIATRRNQGMIEIVISDNGCGIPEISHGDIYTPSFTLKGSKDIAGVYASGIKGTGYGLANVKKYVDKHSGQISFTSTPNKGTTFIISFPITEAASCPGGAKDAAQDPVGVTGKQILVVEDEAAISTVFQKILTHPPFANSVIVADTGKAAMDRFDATKFDLISLDYMLPGKTNGLDVYHYIRKKNKVIPIVFVSGNMEFIASIQQMLQNDPFLAHLSKPCDNATYATAIENWLTRG
ncbi:MAG: ATP-binding protein [Desulfobacterales bacterium]|nr:ATP-binding protein [Desulfobacterales bacterium]